MATAQLDNDTEKSTLKAEIANLREQIKAKERDLATERDNNASELSHLRSQLAEKEHALSEAEQRLAAAQASQSEVEQQLRRQLKEKEEQVKQQAATISAQKQEIEERGKPDSEVVRAFVGGIQSSLGVQGSLLVVDSHTGVVNRLQSDGTLDGAQEVGINVADLPSVDSTFSYSKAISGDVNSYSNSDGNAIDRSRPIGISQGVPFRYGVPVSNEQGLPATESVSTPALRVDKLNTLSLAKSDSRETQAANRYVRLQVDVPVADGLDANDPDTLIRIARAVYKAIVPGTTIVPGGGIGIRS